MICGADSKFYAAVKRTPRRVPRKCVEILRGLRCSSIDHRATRGERASLCVAFTLHPRVQ
jgi:hypothetical protein